MKGFRDLVVWQKSMSLVNRVYVETAMMPPQEKFGLTSQMRRAAVSVPSNIAEGYGRSTSREFLRFLRIANGSLSELETQVLLANSFGWLHQELMGDVSEVGKILQSTIKRIRENLG